MESTGIGTMIDGETVRIIITGLTGLLGTLIGGLLNYLMTRGQMEKELSLEQLRYDNELKIKKEEEAENSLEKKKKIYSDYIATAVRYATEKNNIEELRQKTIDIIFQGRGDVAKAAADYYSDINDELNRDVELALVKHDKHINNIINAIRKEISGEKEEIYVHLVDNDRHF